MDTELNRPEANEQKRRVAEHLLDAVPLLRRIISAESQASDPTGTLTFTQIRALSLLAQGRRLPSELARDLGITPATASEKVELLVRRGLVERSTQTEDRRLTPLRITPAGSERLAAARARSLAGLTRALEGLGPQELEALERGLEPLLKRLLQQRAGVAGSGNAT